MPLSRTNLNLRAAVVALAATASVVLLPSPASAQWFGFGRNRCDRCTAPPPVYSTAYAPTYSTAASSCGCETVSVAAVQPVVQQTACVAVQPVQQTVYQQVPVTKYRTVQKTERRPVFKTAYEEREVTVMQQVTEQRTVDQPYTTYQSVTQYQPQTQDYSRWQTVYRQNAKPSPCCVDGRPGLMGWFGRQRQEFKNAFTPSRVASRQYVPDVRTSMVPVTSQIPVTAMRKVTYNVAKMVPVKQKQRVAVLRQEYEDVPVTAMEPYTEMQTVAVGTRTQMAYVSPYGGTTATAAAPSATRSASADDKVVPRKASNPANGRTKLNSYTPDEPRFDDTMRADGRFMKPELPSPQPKSQLNVRRDVRADGQSRSNDPRLLGYRLRDNSVARTDRWQTRATPKVLQMAGWKPVRPDVAKPELNLAMAD